MPLRLPDPRAIAARPRRWLVCVPLLAAALGATAQNGRAQPSALSAPGTVAAAIPSPTLGDSAIALPLPSLPAGLVGVTRAGAPTGAHFDHTPGLSWDLDVLPYEGHARVQRYVSYFTSGAREKFAEWMARGTRYDAMIRAKLRAGGLPEDLTYLALVESGYDVHAVSRTRAVGMWQFMPQTARDVGLRVDDWVDERRDPVRATDAAVRTLHYLKEQFGSYFVAAAAYNGGPGRVSRGLAQLANADSAGQGGEGRFFALADGNVLHDETKNYVPQLIAAALVAKEAPRYGIPARAVAPLAYDEVRVPGLTPLAAVAAASGASRAELLDLNPHLLRGMTPPGATLPVRVPAGRGEAAAARFATLGDDLRSAFRGAITRTRETWGSLADRLGAPRGVLEAFNGGLGVVRHGRGRGRLVAGQEVRVPTAAVLAYAHASTDDDGPGAQVVDAGAREATPRVRHVRQGAAHRSGRRRHVRG